MRTTLSLDEALGELAAELRDEIPELVEKGLQQMHEEIPEFFVRDDDPDFADVYRRSYIEQLHFIFDRLARDRDLEGREPPPHAAEEARMTANLGIKLGPLLLGYRIAQRLIFEVAMDKCRELSADQVVRDSVLRVTSRWLFAYIDWLTPRMTEVYERERDLLLRDRDRRKRQLVRDLVDGQPVDTGQLGYSLHGEHLGVIAWGQEPERALLALRDATGLALLTVAGTDATAWGWLGATTLGHTELRAVRDFAPPASAHLAIGEPGQGLEGFRVSYRQAWNTYRLSRGRGDPVTWHSDVTLLALTLQDTALAREFVLRELGPLAERDERNELLRDTLKAYFATGQNAASAAAALGVHDRTVLYRLRSIEDRLGRPILARREELGVALRLAPIILATDD
jgi:PucR C-terminal helix-turn-helix domain/GGDEF-like domain